MDEIAIMLQKEITVMLENIANLEPGSNEMKNAIDDLSELYRLADENGKLKNENEKLDIEKAKVDNERNKNLADIAIKERQLSEQRKSDVIRAIIDSAGIVLPLAFYAVWIRLGLKFEENGSLNSAVFKNLWSRIKPAK